jgi:hypothetical protein
LLAILLMRHVRDSLCRPRQSTNWSARQWDAGPDEPPKTSSAPIRYSRP